MSRIIKMTMLAVFLVIALAGGALAFALFLNVQGTVASYDFGSFGPGWPIPGTVEIQGFNMQPGDVVPWHYHKGLSYVIVGRGSIVEQELVGQNQCGTPTTNVAGTAFVETPGRIHQIRNPGPGAAQFYWATVFPQGDPNGDAVFVDGPTCN